MNTHSFTVKALALFALAIPFHGYAESSMSPMEYDAAKDRIEADHSTAMAACDRLVDASDHAVVGDTASKQSAELAELTFQGSSNAKGICIEEANGAKKVALADLEYKRSGSDDDRVKLALAKADAEYEVAKQKCDEMTPNANSVCIEGAKAQAASAKAQAQARR